MIRYMRVHSSHPQVEKVEVVKYAYVFTCAECRREFYVGRARVQADGTLRCFECNDRRGDGFMWCPHCRTAKSFREFEPDRIDAGRHQWCLECVAVDGDEARCCARCGSEFTPKRSDARFCSGRCRVAAHRSV